MKNPSNSTPDTDGARQWFAKLLWRAFPATSEGALAEQAAPVLNVSERQVRNWLRGIHDPGLTVVLSVLAIAGGEVVFQQIEGGRKCG